MAWATVALVVVVLSVSDLPAAERRTGFVLTAVLAAWLFTFFHLLLFRSGRRPWIAWAGVVVDVALAGGIFYVLRGYVPSSQLLFVPVILATGLVGGLVEAVAAAVLTIAAYLGVSALQGGLPELVPGGVNSLIFMVSGLIAGLLARELRLHYSGELSEQRAKVAVRHRLLAVLDAVDEGIVYRDRDGIARVVNRRAAELFEVAAEDHIGKPVIDLLRKVARETEDPEEFMETFQQLRDEPEIELRHEFEQIIPARRTLKLYSGAALDDDGSVVGRIDVYTDVSESRRRSAEIERLYEQARRTAESYQRGLLPESVPSLPRVSIVAHYVAAGGRRAVCGDFYDFVPLPDGRIGLVLGDVVGIGPAAANDAALTRYTLRSLVGREDDPGNLMEEVNAQISRQSSQERFMRVLYGVLDPERALFSYTNAGHVPPVLYRARTGAVEWLAEGGLVLGVERDAVYKTAQLELDPGDMLVLYTDGVTEASREGRPFGQGKFSDLVAQYGVGTPGELVQAMRRSVEAWVTVDESAGPVQLRDDIAILVFQVAPDRLLGEPARELVLPNEPSRVPEVRAFVGHFLNDLRAPVEATGEILLAVGEAAANANRHGRRAEGRSEVRVYCSLEGPSIEITIADDGPGFDPGAAARTLPDRFASGGRGLFLMRELMDEVEFDSSNEGTTVTMYRRISRAHLDD
jgi:serine phosphatase RsbU (regulator of sigma subunit)/anti-sigma regulatory factor (Ser/Thr protein kinase)